MAAGLTDHVWTVRAVLLCRVSSWPQLTEPEAACAESDRWAEGARCARREGNNASQGPGLPIQGKMTAVLTTRSRLRVGASPVSAGPRYTIGFRGPQEAQPSAREAGQERATCLLT
jgi:hypothetical protein